MTDTTAQLSTSKLLSRLKEWNEAYRNGTPLVSDAEYDRAYDELDGRVKAARDAGTQVTPALMQAADFLAGVGAAVPLLTPWVKTSHTMPMGSLNKAQNADDLEAWLTGCGSEVGRQTLFISDKLDGISIGLYYEDGRLVRAVTRGDGEVGEDITRNVLQMKGVVKTIPGFWGFIRGEVVLLHSDWKAHFPEMTNARNGAAGVAKREDGEGVEHLTVFQYQVIVDTRRDQSSTVVDTKSLEFEFLVRIGAQVPLYATKTSLRGVTSLYNKYVERTRAGLDYDIDGLVVEFDRYEDRDALGTRNHRPRGSVAFKFPHDEKPTILRDILWSVGNSGRVTPIAQFDTVNLAGANVTQASLHNLKRFEGLRLSRGCRILVSRRNDVIPMVEANLDEGVRLEDLD